MSFGQIKLKLKQFYQLYNSYFFSNFGTYNSHSVPLEFYVKMKQTCKLNLLWLTWMKVRSRREKVGERPFTCFIPNPSKSIMTTAPQI